MRSSFKINAIICLALFFLQAPSLYAQWTQVGADIDGEANGDLSGASISLSSDGSIMAVGAINNSSSRGHVRVYKNLNGIWAQVGNDIDGEANGDQSGFAVSISSDGSIVAIGAPFNAGGGIARGHVRVYKNISGIWTKQGADIDGEANSDQSGASISISANGNTLAIGASFNAGGGYRRGQVRIYRLLNGNWTQQGADIDGESNDDRSGSSVSLSYDGSTVAIGAPLNAGGGSLYRGHVRVYKVTSNNWLKQGGDIDGEADLDQSGISISLASDGLTVAIGARQNAGGGNYRGHVRVYKKIINTWIQQGTDIDGEFDGYRTRLSVSLSSNGLKLAIGAFQNSGSGYYRGHVRIYSILSGSWTQQGLDIDGEADTDYSGSVVSLSPDGYIVAIGATNNAGGGTQRGHVRVYKYTTPWTQIGTDIDGNQDVAYSGYSVSLASDGQTVAIGEPKYDGVGTNAGRVRIFKNINGSWTQKGADIEGEAAFDNSGTSVSLSANGSIIATGAFKNAGGGIARGHVRVFQFIGNNWIQQGGNIDGEADQNSSGSAISLSSDGLNLAIGAVENAGGGLNRGHVRVFKFSNGSWIQRGLDIEGEADQDRSGNSVSISANGLILAIGATLNAGGGNQRGHTRVYKYIGGAWIKLGNDIDGETDFDNSGWSVSLSSDGSIVAIGAVYYPNLTGKGHVRIYKFNGISWIQLGADIDGEGFSFSEASVSLSSDGTIVAIGANLNSGNGTNSGHVRIYKNINGVWTQQGIDIDGEAAYDYSGKAVSLSSNGTIVAIGAFQNAAGGSYRGHTRVFSRIIPTPTLLARIVATGTINTATNRGGAINPTANRGALIDICHLGLNTIQVGSEWELVEHLAHGDYLGPCDPLDNINLPNAKDNLIGLAEAERLKMKKSISYLSDNSFMLYPNPAQNILNVKLSFTTDQEIQIQVYNSLGQAVLKKNNYLYQNRKSDIPINIEKLPHGLYFLKASLNGQEVIKPFTKF